MYAASDLTMRQVAEECGVTASGLSAHIGKYHRDLLLSRYGLADSAEGKRHVQVKAANGQSLSSRLKYKDAIAACGDVAYIEYNVAQVANLFRLDGSALASQLRVHYPGVIEQREKLRRRLGIADNAQRGARQCSIDAYAQALELYRDTDLTVTEVAERCGVSKSGFRRFMRFYHKDILAVKASRRRAAAKAPASRSAGALAGNGGQYGPKPATVALYAKALDLYRTSSLTVDEIIEKTAVPPAGFKGYLSQWHRPDRLLRQGGECEGSSDEILGHTPHYRKSTAEKYRAAIASLKSNPRPIAEAAREFGHNPDIFRDYLRKHEPALVAAQGMVRLPNGRLVKQSAMDKYGRALEEYGSTAESLKSIAQRHGLVYNSICNFITRNCPELRQQHDHLAAASGERL